MLADDSGFVTDVMSAATSIDAVVLPLRDLLGDLVNRQ
jgi:hypothetical protein